MQQALFELQRMCLTGSAIGHVTSMSTAIAIIGAVLAIAVVIWFVAIRKHPEDASGHPEPDRTGTAMMHGDTDDRPAGPGAEDEFVSGDGQIGPGPSAENLPSPSDIQPPRN